MKQFFDNLSDNPLFKLHNESLQTIKAAFQNSGNQINNQLLQTVKQAKETMTKAPSDHEIITQAASKLDEQGLGSDVPWLSREFSDFRRDLGKTRAFWRQEPEQIVERLSAEGP